MKRTAVSAYRYKETDEGDVQMNEMPALARVVDCGPAGLRSPATIAIPAVLLKVEKRSRGRRPK